MDDSKWKFVVAAAVGGDDEIAKLIKLRAQNEVIDFSPMNFNNSSSLWWSISMERFLKIPRHLLVTSSSVLSLLFHPWWCLESVEISLLFRKKSCRRRREISEARKKFISSMKKRWAEEKCADILLLLALSLKVATQTETCSLVKSDK